MVHWTGEFILALIWLAVVLSIGSIGLLYWLIRRSAATSVASLFYLVPAVTALMAYVLFGERLDAIAIAGMVACAAAVFLVNRARRNRRHERRRHDNSIPRIMPAGLPRSGSPRVDPEASARRDAAISASPSWPSFSAAFFVAFLAAFFAFLAFFAVFLAAFFAAFFTVFLAVLPGGFLGLLGFLASLGRGDFLRRLLGGAADPLRPPSWPWSSTALAASPIASVT